MEPWVLCVLTLGGLVFGFLGASLVLRLSRRACRCRQAADGVRRPEIVDHWLRTGRGFVDFLDDEGAKLSLVYDDGKLLLRLDDEPSLEFVLAVHPTREQVLLCLGTLINMPDVAMWEVSKL